MSELIFLVEEDPDGGYSARALGVSIFTQADNWEGIKKNIQEAVACHFEEDVSRPKILRLHLVRDEVMAL
jgi:hypothetical protein